MPRSSRRGRSRAGQAGRRPRSRGRVVPPILSARTADRYDLYERAVQEPAFDIRFITRIFRQQHGRLPLSLREDFCGTAYLAAEWVASRRDRVALAIDLDRTALEWCRRRHLPRLGPAARRLHLLRQNVLAVVRPKVDVTAAFNYSYNVFLTRPELTRYFRMARRGLRPDGAFVLDTYSGPDALRPLKETRRYRGFTYIWDQRPVDALSGRAIRHIHFRFPDGTTLRRAFTYDWRIWSVPELRDALEEVGFSRIDLHNGFEVYRKVERAEYAGALIPLLVAWR